ncbi:hypothetical protein [Mycetocola saprophilus]|uniref:hypothetical protein n=1 Tax=Mycetocola saprophilus TaxID=76636 RepID=UPI003BF42039
MELKTARRRGAKLAAVLVALIAFAGSPAIANATSPHASPENEQTGSVAKTSSALSQDQVVTLGTSLKAGNSRREVRQTSFGEQTTFLFDSGLRIGFTYDLSGQPIVLPKNHPDMEARVEAGADPFPYVSFDSAEQAAGAAGSVGVLVGAVCASLGPETAGVGCVVAGGIGATIVGILTAHGVCDHEQNYRIYVLTLEGQCRND